MKILKNMIDKLVKNSEAYKALFAGADSKIMQFKGEIESLLDENRELKERIPEIADKLCKFRIEKKLNDPTDRKLRICVDLDPIIIEDGFMHGNDETVIKYIGQDIGYRISREITRANFHRWMH
jgi:hypothetical protein